MEASLRCCFSFLLAEIRKIEKTLLERRQTKPNASRAFIEVSEVGPVRCALNTTPQVRVCECVCGEGWGGVEGGIWGFYATSSDNEIHCRSESERAQRIEQNALALRFARADEKKN